MQLYNKMSAEERAKLIDEAGKDRLTISFYHYYNIENPQQFRDQLFIANKIDNIFYWKFRLTFMIFSSYDVNQFLQFLLFSYWFYAFFRTWLSD